MNKKSMVVVKRTIDDEIFLGLLATDGDDIYTPDANIIISVAYGLAKAVYINIPAHTVFSDSETGAVSPNGLWKKIKTDFLNILRHEYNLIFHPNAVDCFRGINRFFSMIMEDSFTSHTFVGNLEDLTITKTDKVDDVCMYKFEFLGQDSKIETKTLLLGTFSNDM